MHALPAAPPPSSRTSDSGGTAAAAAAAAAVPRRSPAVPVSESRSAGNAQPQSWQQAGNSAAAGQQQKDATPPCVSALKPRLTGALQSETAPGSPARLGVASELGGSPARTHSVTRPTLPAIRAPVRRPDSGSLLPSSRPSSSRVSPGHAPDQSILRQHLPAPGTSTSSVTGTDPSQQRAQQQQQQPRPLSGLVARRSLEGSSASTTAAPASHQGVAFNNGPQPAVGRPPTPPSSTQDDAAPGAAAQSSGAPQGDGSSNAPGQPPAPHVVASGLSGAGRPSSAELQGSQPSASGLGPGPGSAPLTAGKGSAPLTPTTSLPSAAAATYEPVTRTGSTLTYTPLQSPSQAQARALSRMSFGAASQAATAPPAVSLPSFSSARSGRASSVPRSRGALGSGSLAAFAAASGLRYSPSVAAAAAGECITLRVHVVTFNMGNVAPSRLPVEMFGAHRGDADLYVVGTQESCGASDLERLLDEALPATEFVRVVSRGLMSIQLNVFVRKDIQHLASCVSAVAVPCGIGNVIGNKGGVAIDLQLAGAHMLLVNSHLAAHDEFVERRNADFQRICAGLPLPPQRMLALSAPGAGPSFGSGGSFSGSAGPGAGVLSANNSLTTPMGSLGSALGSGGSFGNGSESLVGSPAKGGNFAAGYSSLPAGGLSGGGGGGGFSCVRGAAVMAVVPTQQAAMAQPTLQSFPDRIRTASNASSAFAASAVTAAAAVGSGSSSFSAGAAGLPPAAATAAPRVSPLSLRLAALSTQRSDSPGALASPSTVPESPLPRPGGTPHAPHNYHPSAGPGSLKLPSRWGSASGPESMRAAEGSGSFSKAGSAGVLAGVEGGASAAAAAAAGPSTNALDHYDVVLWAGDLNYRIKGTPAGIKRVLERGLNEVLVANDQLGEEQRAGRAFQGFHEQPLNFLPTFKFNNNSDEYNLKRVPSYTDRVLFMCNSPPAYCALRPLYYTSVLEMKESDHRPVVAGFEVVLNPSKKHTRHHVEF